MYTAMNISLKEHKTPVGELLLGIYNNQLCLADWRYRKMRSAIDRRIESYFNAQFVFEDHPMHETIIQQLNEYFIGKRKTFDLPLVFAGSEFQKTVWSALLDIPYGTSSTYLELAKNLRNEKAIRAVASANGANAISIIVPCHRVIGSNGDLVGYAGGLSAKKRLLQLEGLLPDNQLDLFTTI